MLSREGRRPLAVQSINGQDMFAVEDLARLFNFTTREDTLAAGLTVTVRGQTIVLSPGQELASVAGRLVSLSAPPRRDGRAWFVPTDFLSRALAPVAGTRITCGGRRGSWWSAAFASRGLVDAWTCRAAWPG